VLYWDAQWRAQGCLNISRLAIEDVDCSAAIPWLIALLRDEAIAWSPSIFIPYTGTPVHREAATTLGCIGPPAVPALRDLLSSDNPKLRERASDVLTRIQAANGSATADSKPSKEE
jgi:HEAT repeat protein